jgi:hypothetical protein
MDEIAEALYSLSNNVSTALKYLGNGDAATPMGAIEAHGKAILDASERIALSLDGIAEAINRLADCMPVNSMEDEG